jgi:RNA polymerase sigma-70 factor (ECF subfamily)
VSIHKNPPDIHRIIDEEPSPADQLIQQQNLAQLKAFIRKLKPHYQEVINLRYFQELSYKEISEKLDEPMNNVKVKLLRAKKLLAEIIKNK